MNTKVHALLALTMFIWAGSFVFIKIGLRELDPYNLAFYRFLIASPVIFLWVWLRRGLASVNRRDLVFISILALSGVSLLYAFQFLALKYTTATNASILINTSAIFVAVWGFVNEGANARRILGVTISFAGVVLLVSRGTADFFTSKTFFGDALMIVDGLLWAVYTVLGARMLVRYNHEILTAYTFALGTVYLIPFALWNGFANPFNLHAETVVSILYLSILCSVFAYVVWYYALSNSDSTSVAVYVYLVPLFTAVFAFFALNETPDIFTAIGGTITIVGVYITVSASS
ncbi:DMT family transporter [Archaeoglobus neptunius]|uniref:DMT family transporter n=1 Tax=Archaeoglobus neptunius TaxID=2798580 RepID=UPI001925B91B|nr:DMT family transporter [Archaeoglobus neptunius]